MTRPLRVYVAGPYTSNPEKCTAAAIAVGNELLDAGHAPFVPHLAHYWETLHGARHYEDWMRIDLAWLETADAVIRIPGASSGADRETARATELGIPVCDTVQQLLDGPSRCPAHTPAATPTTAPDAPTTHPPSPNAPDPRRNP